MLCILIEVYRRFGGTKRLYLQATMISEAISKKKAALVWFLLVACLTSFDPEDGGSTFRKSRKASTRLYGVTSQKTVHVIVTAVRTPNPTQILFENADVGQHTCMHRKPVFSILYTAAPP
jgi:hypothetical protein